MLLICHRGKEAFRHRPASNDTNVYSDTNVYFASGSESDSNDFEIRSSSDGEEYSLFSGISHIMEASTVKCPTVSHQAIPRMANLLGLRSCSVFLVHYEQVAGLLYQEQ